MAPSPPGRRRRPRPNRARAVSSSKPSAAARAAGDVVPAPAPGKGELEWHVGEVVDGAVDVAADRHPGRRALAVDVLTVREAVGADHAGEADVDHLPLGRHVGGVEGDQGHDPGDEQAPRCDRQQSVPTISRPKAGDQHPHEEIGEHRVDEPDRGLDLRVVEEGERDAEAQQREQVEVDQPERPARVDERSQEEHAERQPEPEARDLARDRPGVAARELRLHLLAGPLLDDACGRVLDHHLAHVLSLRIEVIDLPLPYRSGAAARTRLEAANRAPGRERPGGDGGGPPGGELEARWSQAGRERPGEPRDLAPERRLIGGVEGPSAACLGGRRQGGEQADAEQRGQRQPHPRRVHSQWLSDSGPAQRPVAQLVVCAAIAGAQVANSPRLGMCRRSIAKATPPMTRGSQKRMTWYAKTAAAVPAAEVP